MKTKLIQKITVITLLLVLSVSCVVKERSATHTQTPTKASPTTTPTKTPKEGAPANNSWENYLIKLIEARKANILWEQRESQIDLEENIKQGKISIDSSFDYASYKDSISYSFLIDLDKDKIDELCMVTCAGSVRDYTTYVFKKENGVYVNASIYDGAMDSGYIFPYKHNNEIHYIEIINEFETKFMGTIIEFELNGLTFIPKRVFKINYTYDVSNQPKVITDMIDNKYLNELNKYIISDSNIAQITSSHLINLTDMKNNNFFKFTANLWSTSVGHAPSHWELESEDNRTLKFKGIDKVLTHKDLGTDINICFGFKFYKDEMGNVFLLKVSYPFFTIAERKDGDLTLQLFKFNKNSVDEVYKKLVEPKVEVIVKDADSDLNDNMGY